MKSSDFYYKSIILAWIHVVWAILRQNRLGLWPPGVSRKKSQKVSDSHRNDVSPLTQGLRYRAACDKVAHGLAPGYLGPSTCVADLPSRRSLHFVGNNRLAVPISRLSTVGGSRAFSVASSQTSRKTWHQPNHWPNFLACYSVTLSVRLSLSVRNVVWLNGAA